GEGIARLSDGRASFSTQPHTSIHYLGIQRPARESWCGISGCPPSGSRWSLSISSTCPISLVLRSHRISRSTCKNLKTGFPRRPRPSMRTLRSCARRKDSEMRLGRTDSDSSRQSGGHPAANGFETSLRNVHFSRPGRGLECRRAPHVPALDRRSALRLGDTGAIGVPDAKLSLLSN